VRRPPDWTTRPCFSIRSRPDTSSAGSTRQRNTVAQAQAHEQLFKRLVVRGERRLLDDAVAVAGEGAQPVLRLLVALGGVGAAPAMGAGADAEIGPVAPVSEVVAALLAGRGVVRYS
jgi:hypothetical protein